MQALPLLVILAAFAASSVYADESRPPAREGSCDEPLNGVTRCKGSDGHVETRKVDEFGRVVEVTSTDKRRWGDHVRGDVSVKPPPGMLEAYPEYRRALLGRTTEPWKPQPHAAPAPTGVKIRRPDGTEGRCTPDGGVMRCR